VVRGLDVFREHFAGHVDQFVLIGSAAATLAMEEAGSRACRFRAGAPFIRVFLCWTVDFARIILRAVLSVYLPVPMADELLHVNTHTKRRPP